MKLVFFFLASVLFTAAAIPMPPPQGSPSVLNPNYVPKVDFGDTHMYSNDKTVATDMVIDHYKGLEPGNDYKEAKLAFAKKGWRDGERPDDEHKQYLNFDYHRGNTPNSAKIGQTVTISRDRPPPEPRFRSSVPYDHRPEISGEINKKYNALPPHLAKYIRSMRVEKGWGDGPGLREETKFTYHHGAMPGSDNHLGNPVTIYRPMSVHVDDSVPEKQIPIIKRRIRHEHEMLDENHPLKKANYGVVTEGWHKPQGESRQRVVPTLYKVKDKLSVSAEEDFTKIGNFYVSLGRGRKSTAESSLSSSASQS